ncbi:MAG: serine/threonine-protein kinase [Pirellulaceae bacterium]|nr:serine/threonine-protein kinase [Pirellulaceae bacterium]
MDDASDRNLLFGILAVQFDFVRASEFMEAANQWMLQKSSSLGEILVSRAYLSDEDRRFIDTIVEKHISRSGSPHKSLELLSNSSIEISDLTLRGEILTKGHSSFRAASDAESEHLTVSQTTAGDLSIIGERFAIVRELAHGGLGEVFVARDRELDREVALKKILEKHRGRQEIRDRFIVEAKVTGGLEHPGIVPVYGLGAFPNGAPFYAMRLIRGKSLQDSLKSLHVRKEPHSAAKDRVLRGLIRAVIDACNAVGYANSRGVIHRDIKPHNIMIGRFGETLVVDWGLAKVIGIEDTDLAPSEMPLDEPRQSDSAPTTMGSILGTHEFMCPEQANGRIDLIDRRSDVFSLGATLFAVLTGRPPYKQDNRPDTLVAAQTCDFPSPRKLNPAIPRSLEAICLKAMAKDRQDRYSNAVELAEDLDNWIAGAPVDAYPEPLTQRAMRFARKHQVAVASAFVFLCVASVGLLLSNWLIGKERDRANEASEVATQERKTAEFAAATTIAVLDTFVKNIVDDKWSRFPELDDERFEMVDMSLDKFVELSEKAPTNLRITKSVCQLYIRSSNLYRHRGDYIEAAKRLERAHQIAEQLIQAPDGGPEFFFLLTDSQFYLTECEYAQWGAVKSVPVAEKLKQLCTQRLTVERSQSALRAHALAQLLLSEIKCEFGDCDFAIQEATEGINLLERLPVSKSQPFVETLFIASGNVKLASAQLAKDAFDEAGLTAGIALDQARKGAENYSDVIDFKTTEAEAAIVLAWIEFWRNNYDASTKYAELAVEVSESLCEASQTNLAYRRLEAEAFQVLGLNALQKKDRLAALSAAKRSQESLDFVFAERPANASTFPVQLITHAVHLHSLPDDAPDRPSLEQLLSEQLEGLRSQNPSHPALRKVQKLAANFPVSEKPSTTR